MGNNYSERNERIVKKIQGLLALSENNPNEEEAQSAFLMSKN
ncbi:DUF2786 domain-containing protein [Virgibacillus proomii]|nr:DUF2786 domain-containing protein [Virgibacillus proomii]MBU5267879.1 DUF2786 domain-containing protein [Virgibacillus proomii]